MISNNKPKKENRIMTPLPQNPVVVVLVNEQREVVASATNVSPDLKIVTTRNAERFEQEALGKSFVDRKWMNGPEN